MANLKKIDKNIFFSSIVIFILICSHVIYYINIEQSIYSWDQILYWDMFYRFNWLFNSNPVSWFITAFSEIISADYNPAPILLLFPFYYIIEDSRICYILAVSISYLFVISLIMARFFTKTDDFNLKNHFFFVLLIISTFVAFWKPVLRGYPDIVGLIPLIFCLFIIIKTDFTEKVNFKQAIILGILLWSAFLLRRWYAYTVVTLYFTLPLLNFFVYSKEKDIKLKLKEIKTVIKNFFIAGLHSVYFAAIFQYKLLSNILTTDYADVYSAYQGSFLDSLELVISNVGLYILPLFLVGIIYCLVKINTKIGKIGIFCFATLAISFVLFTRTQVPGIQHCLPFALWILIIAIIGLGALLSFFKNNYLRKVSILIIGSLSLYVMLTTLYRLPEPWISNSQILPTKSYSLHLDNYDNYLEMTDSIEKLTMHGDSISILSSSDLLNISMLSTISKGRLNNRLQFTSQVDLRDKLTLATFNTRYVLVTDPVQLHLVPEGQRVISIPVQQILSETGIGKAYVKLPYDFALEDGIHAYLYEKVRPFTQQEAQDFLNQFVEFYPQWQSDYGDGLAISILTE